MHSRLRESFCAALALAFAPGLLGAQSSVGYVGLHHTPIGMLPPLVTPSMVGDAKTGVSIALRYGELPKSEDANNKTTAFAGTLAWSPTPRSALAISAGEYHETCPDPECSSKFMFDVAGDLRVASLPIGTETNGPLATVSVRGSIGSGEEQFDTRYLVWHIGVPFALVLPVGNGFRITPHVVPGYGWARASTLFIPPAGDQFRGTLTGNRPTLGGGIDFSRTGGGGALQVGAMNVPFPHGRTVFGVGLAIRP